MVDRRWTLSLVLCLVVAALVAAAQPAFAQDAPPTVIYACASAKSVRFVERARDCRRGVETVVNWLRLGTLVDADDTAIGPMLALGTVLTEVDGSRYSIPVGPAGWTFTDPTFTYFDAACTDGPYLNAGQRAVGEPAPPATGGRYFIPPLIPFQPATDTTPALAYKYGGTIVAGPSAPGSLWRRVSATGPCEVQPVSYQGVPYFENLVLVTLPDYTTPFAVR